MKQAARDPLYEPLAPDVIADPHPFYRRLREHQRVHWHAGLDSWAVTGYQECRQVLGDTAAFGSDFRRAGAEIPEVQLSVQSLDPPAHGAIRHLLVAAFQRRSAAGMAERVGEIAESRWHPLVGRDRPVDLVREFARPVALDTVCEFLGVPVPDGDRFEELSNAIVRGMDAGLDPSRAEPGTLARGELSRLVDGWSAGAEGTGFLAAVRDAARETPQVPSAVLANSLRAVLHAGYESVSRLLGNVLARLVASPGLLADLDPAELGALVDELVRLDGPVQADARVCVRDTAVGSVPVRRGDVVVLFLAAANRDPAVFTDPDAVVLGRTRPHLAFGRGAHACLGAALAKMQLRSLLSALKASDVDLLAVEPPVYEPTATLRGLVSLSVTVRAHRRH
jgi:cytochrome P450